MNLAQLIRKMGPRQRQMLRESVSRLLKEDDTKDVNGVTFKKVTGGWQSTYEATADEILKLVRPDVQDLVRKELKQTKDGEDYELLRTSLIPGVWPGAKGKLVFRRVGEKFIDPTTIPEDVFSNISNNNPITDVVTAVGMPGGGGRWTIGDAIVDVDAASVTVTVTPANSYGGFADLFGKESAFGTDVFEKVQKQAKNADGEIRIPIELASEDALLKKLSKNIFNTITFERKDSNYVATFEKLSSGKIDVIKGILNASPKAAKAT